MVNLFGNGFIGSAYSKLYPCRINDKHDLVPQLDGVTDVFYLISTVDNYHVKTNPYIDIDTNLTTLIKVLENFRKDPLSKDVVFNFASSWFVYGVTDLPAKETATCDPKGFYSITKRAAEQLLISYCETYGLKYRILRFANVLGPGDSKVSKKKNAVTYLINRMKQNLPVELYDGGEFVRDYIHVNDLCKAVHIVMESGQVNEIYNIGNGVPTRFADIVQDVLELGSTSEVKNIQTADLHKNVQVKNIYMDTEKLKKLGYTPEHNIKSTIIELFYLQNSR